MTFQEWLRTPGLDRCYLLEIDYLQYAEPGTLRRATHPYRTGASDEPSWYPYPDTILRLPEFDRDMSEVFSGASRVAIGEMELYLDEQLQELVETAVFSGYEVRIYVGDASWPKSRFGQILVGQVEQLDVISYDTAKLSFKDRATIFSKPIQPRTIQVGPNIGNPVPLCFGQCFNISPVLLDPVTKRYRVHDGAVDDIVAVRENGQPIPFTKNNAGGTFTLQNNAQGRVTADVRGAVVNGLYLTNANHFIDHIVKNIANQAAPIGALLPDYALGIFINSESTISDILDEISVSVGGAWFFDRLNRFIKVHIGGVNYDNFTDTLTLDDIEDDSLLPVRRIPPARRVSLGYARNWTPQADGLAGVIRENNPELATRYEQKDSSVVANDPTMEEIHPDSVMLTVSTLIVNRDEAMVEATRRLMFAGVQRTVYEVKAFAAPFAMSLGQTIRIHYPKYFKDGRDAVITRLNDLPGENSVLLEVWR